MGDLSKLVSLSWPDHVRVFLTGIWTCFLEKYKTDVEVYCSGHRVNVHQVVLAIFCPEFKQQQQAAGQDLNLCFDSAVGLEEADLGLLIEFIYRGKINVSRDRLGVLREAGLAFGLQVLVDLIDQEEEEQAHQVETQPPETQMITTFNETTTTVCKSEPAEQMLQLPPFHSICPAEVDEPGEKSTETKISGNKRSRRTTTRYETLSRKMSSRATRKSAANEADLTAEVNVVAAAAAEDTDGHSRDDVEEEEEDEESSESSDETGGKKSRQHTKRRERSFSEAKTPRGLRKPKQFLKCPHCSYGTSRKQLYLNHLDTHDRSVKRYVCDICSKAFRNNSSFGRHVYFHKNPDKLLRCSHCDYNTMQRSVWIQHLAIRHQLDPEGNPLKKDIRCPDCEFVCITDYQLKSHAMRKHSIKSFKCGECDYCSVMKADLEKHVQIRHRNYRPYMCETCGYRSKTRSHFNCHLQMHTGVKPFKCHLCGQAYTRSNKLKEHLRSHVSNEKPFLCHLCSYACRRNYNLKLHIKRIHKDGSVGKGRGAPRTEKQEVVEDTLGQVMQVDVVQIEEENEEEQKELKLDDEDEEEEEDDEAPLQPQAVIQLQTMEPITVMSGVSLTTVCMTGLECLQPYHPLE